MTPIELTIVIIIAIVVGSITISNVAGSIRKIKLAKLGYQESRDGKLVRL